MSASEFDVEGLLGRVEPRATSRALDARVSGASAGSRPRGMRGLAFSAAAVALLAVAFHVLLPARGGAARIVEVKGDVRAAGRPAAAGVSLRGGDLLETAPGASIAFVLPDGSRLDLEGGSGVVVGGPRATEPVARLVRGAVRCRVATGPEAFRVSTDRGEVAAVGTEFLARMERPGDGREVSLTEGGDASVRGPVLVLAVLEGVVELREPGRTTRVGRRSGLIADGSGPPRVTGLTEGSGPEPLPSSQHLDCSRAVAAIRLSPDGDRLAIAIHNLNGGGLAEYSAPFVGVHVYDLRTGRMTASVKLDGDLSDIAWFADGSLWATEGLNNEVRRVDLEKGEVAESRSLMPDPQVHRGTNTDRIVPSPDRRLAVATGFNGCIDVYEMPGWKRLRTLDGPRSGVLTHGTWSADGKRWLSSTPEGKVVAWDVATGERSVLGEGHFPVVGPGGRIWAYTADKAAFGPVEPAEGEKRDAIAAGCTWFAAAAFSPDGRFLAVGNDKGTVAVLDVKTGAEFAKFGHVPAKGAATAYVTALEWSRDSAWVAAGRADGSSDLLRPEETE